MSNNQSITNNQSKNMPYNLPPAKPIEQLFFYKIFLCLVYSDGAWKIFYEDGGGWVGTKGGKEKAMEAADNICKNRDKRADREQP